MRQEQDGAGPCFQAPPSLERQPHPPILSTQSLFRPTLTYLLTNHHPGASWDGWGEGKLSPKDEDREAEASGGGAWPVAGQRLVHPTPPSGCHPAASAMGRLPLAVTEGWLPPLLGPQFPTCEMKRLILTSSHRAPVSQEIPTLPLPPLSSLLPPPV